jgi:hypothetical protein
MRAAFYDAALVSLSTVALAEVSLR